MIQNQQQQVTAGVIHKNTNALGYYWQSAQSGPQKPQAINRN